jgi:DNA-binding NarL/FixJ family response regulator
LRLLTACGAQSLADQIEPMITGGRTRPAGPDSLTPHQYRLIRLALSGQTNKEIAQDLAVTTRTVEFHFTRIYQKLGIRRRAQLASALGDTI